MDENTTILGSIWNRGKIYYKMPKITLFATSFVWSLIAIGVRGNFYNVSTWENGMIASNIIRGLGFSGTYLVGPPVEPTSVMAPFYPYFLATVYTVFGLTPLAFITIQVIQAIIQAFSVVLLFLIGRQIFNMQVGLFAGVGLALYPDYAYGVTVIHQLTFSTFITLLLIYSLVQLEDGYSIKNIVVSGTILGVATLIIPAVLYFAPIIPLWLIGQTYLKRWSFSEALKMSCLITIVPLLIVAPWTIRNYIVHDQFVLVKQVGWNFWRGNVPPAIHTGVPNELSDAPSIVQKKVEQMPEAEANKYLLNRALEYIIYHPRNFLIHFFKNIWYFWWFPPMEQKPAQSNIIRKLFYVPVLSMGVIGIIKSRRRWKKYTLFYGIFFSFSIGYSIFFIQPRYRTPTIQPFLILFAAFFAYRIIRKFKMV
ncbi:glycosyltransferase family 39 protein [Halobaculum sp. CBA1158]|uniref:ArnT family glycosyltransferase n=1 Tax=Halobaculum sp. CBA1158 TaxID=2904243 RepID=UPI001F2F1DBE|nr:glycosyltransferase family 39 protein [Halobaculum sp. CBA1158]UIP00993.1 glycosyltransferase family 39 protein [Halobaculum sp. CBA1158]